MPHTGKNRNYKSKPGHPNPKQMGKKMKPGKGHEARMGTMKFPHIGKHVT